CLSTLMDDFMGSIQSLSNIQSHIVYFQLSQIYSLAAKRLRDEPWRFLGWFIKPAWVRPK
ncbi:MAG: hypothetical protein ACKN82_13230, partial [Pirellula sp.]